MRDWDKNTVYVILQDLIYYIKSKHMSNLLTLYTVNTFAVTQMFISQLCKR